MDTQSSYRSTGTTSSTTGITVAKTAAGEKTARACINCHKAKVKCVRENEDAGEVPCTRCHRLGLACEQHVSRQGQGPRRSRKKVKACDGSVTSSASTGPSGRHSASPPADFADVAAAAAAARASAARLSSPLMVPLPTSSSSCFTAPMDALAVAAASLAATSGGYYPGLSSSAGGVGGGGAGNTNQRKKENNNNSSSSSSNNKATSRTSGGNNSNIASNVPRMNSSGSQQRSQSHGSSNAAAATSTETSTTSADHGDRNKTNQSLEVEDEIICKGIHDLGYNHFGLHHLIRTWTCLSYTRRSFNLLARASFLASRCGITMDEVLSNESPFAKLTNARPLSFLQNTILLPKHQQNVLGPRLSLTEIPLDLLQTVHIDPRSEDTYRNRWFSIRMTQLGRLRVYNSPNFERDLATTDEMERTWVENKQEIIDIFLTKPAKIPFGRDLLQQYYLNKEYGKSCFVTRCQTFVKLKIQPDQPVEMDVINSMKLVDLDTEFLYMEFQSKALKRLNSCATFASVGNKRQYESITSSIHDNDEEDDDPLMSDEFDYTELPLNDELEEWMNILGQENPNAAQKAPTFM